MPIREESFRIGCGRYLQGKGYVDKTGDEVLRLGKSPLVIGGEKALGTVRENLEKSLSAKCNIYEIITYKGTCNQEKAKEFALLAKNNNYDVIVGVGGGVMMDFAKLCAHFANLPVINIPTSSATCAAYTPLSVCYTPEGKTVGTTHFENEVNCVIVDTEIISAQPTRLFLAGVFDALAKFVEIKHRFTTDVKGYPTGLDYAYIMSKYTFELLNSKVQLCIDDMANGNLSDDVENVIFTTIAATGVISGIARGSNQTAIAHKFYENIRFLAPESSKFCLHGEAVGVGLLLQNHFNGEQENNKLILDLMKRYHMPYRITDLGVEKTDYVFNVIYDRICSSSAINKNDKNECEKFKKSLEYLWTMEEK